MRVKTFRNLFMFVLSCSGVSNLIGLVSHISAGSWLAIVSGIGLAATPVAMFAIWKCMTQLDVELEMHRSFLEWLKEKMPQLRNSIEDIAEVCDECASEETVH